MRAITFFPFVDQSSSRGLEKSGENIPTIPEVIRAHTLNFKPHFKFSSSFFFGGGPCPSSGVRLQVMCNLYNAYKNFREHVCQKSAF